MVRIGVLGGDGLWSVAEVLRASGVEVVDLEPAPKQVAASVARKWHYGLSSVRAGLLGEPALIRTILTQVSQGLPRGWMRLESGLAYDPFRPDVDPEGLPEGQAETYRLSHLAALARLPAEVDRLILPICHLSGDINEMLADLQWSCEALRRVNPGLVVQVTLQPSLTATPAALEDLQRLPHDPVFDALLAARAKGGKGAALLAHLAQGFDLDAFAASPATPEEPVEKPMAEAPMSREERRARRKNKKENRNAVICEDELLEAFSK